LAGDGHGLPLSQAISLVFTKNPDLGFGASDSGLLSATIASVVVLILLYLRLSYFDYRMGGVTELASALILGGCLGILIDRVGRGFVVDWLDLGPHSQFIYNFADLAVMLAAVLLIARAVHFFSRKENRQMLARNGKDEMATAIDPEAGLPLVTEVEAGPTAARILRDRFGALSPRQLAETLGVEIRWEARSVDGSAGLVIRSAYLPDPPTIVLYREPLAELADLIAARRPEWSGLDLEALHIAHEIYHYLAAGGPVDCESAAHAFVEELLQLDFSPKMLDSLYHVDK
jgi:signal peptidase II